MYSLEAQRIAHLDGAVKMTEVYRIEGTAEKANQRWRISPAP